jgi:beta-N-acetylhexosaminidase
MPERVMAMGEATSLADRKRRAGQRLVIGLAGLAVDDNLRRLVREVRPSGFILFQRNVAEPAQVLDLNRELASLCDQRYPAFLTVDQEGGRVQRIRDPATVWPSMRVVGGVDQELEAVSRAMADELRAMGFNLNFAPVADVDSNPDNPVIGDRSFGRDPARVAEQVVRFAQAHQGAGMIACVKHFPGHGDTATDSHLALPSVEKTESELRACELVPFAAAMRAGVATVMSSHVVFPALDPDLPVTLSPVVMPQLLRKEMGFDGVIFSDDMEMKAVHGRWDVTQQVDLGTRAGVDVYLACESPELQVQMFEALVMAQEVDDGQDRAAKVSLRRITQLRERFFLKPPRVPELDQVGHRDNKALADRIRARRIS